MKWYCFLIAVFSYSSAKAQHTVTVSDTAFFYKLAIDTVVYKEDALVGCPVRSITITKKKDNSLAQVIKPDENYILCNFDSSKKQFFAVEDMNFDGHNDFRLLTAMTGRGRNLTYYYWLYNASLQLFVANTTFRDLTEPEFDAGSKKITSTHSEGTASSGSTQYELYEGKLRVTRGYFSNYHEYTGDYLDNSAEYVYINGKQIENVTKSETFDEKKKLIVTMVSKRVNGKMKVVSVKKERAVKSKY